MKIIYDIITGEVIRNTGTNSLFPEGVPDETLNLSETQATYSLHDINNRDTVQKIISRCYYELIFDVESNPAGVKLYPKISISADKQQITTTETCIVTATITPAEGDTLVDEEVIFTVDGTDYPVMTTNGQAQIEYSNANLGQHIIQVRSATKYGQNSITVEVV